MRQKTRLGGRGRTDRLLRSGPLFEQTSSARALKARTTPGTLNLLSHCLIWDKPESDAQGEEPKRKGGQPGPIQVYTPANPGLDGLRQEDYLSPRVQEQTR